MKIMNNNVKALKKYYANATKEEVIEDMFRDICYLQKKLDKAYEHIKECCYYPDLNNYSNMLDDEVKELVNIINPNIFDR